MSMQEAFLSVIPDAVPARHAYVSLYIHTRPYGGPEEGGWWRDHYTLMATKEFPTEALAETAKVEVEKLAGELIIEAQQGFGEQCKREMEWCESRGLDADYLPEVDGDTIYFVSIEEQPGQGEAHDMGGYE